MEKHKEKHTDISQITADRLSRLLNEQNRSQAWLARKIHISPPSVCNWLSGKKGMSKENAKLCAEALGCSAAYLLGLTNFKTMKDEMQDFSDRVENGTKKWRERNKTIKDLMMKTLLLDYELRDTDHQDQFLRKKKGGYCACVSESDIGQLCFSMYHMIEVYIDNYIRQNEYISDEEKAYWQEEKKRQESGELPESPGAIDGWFDPPDYYKM